MPRPPPAIAYYAVHMRTAENDAQESLFGVVDEFVPSASPGVTTHVGTGLAGTVRGDGKWRPLPLGSCDTCMSSSGKLRPGLKGYMPSIQCDRHVEAKYRKPRPAGVQRWPFEEHMVFDRAA